MLIYSDYMGTILGCDYKSFRALYEGFRLFRPENFWLRLRGDSTLRAAPSLLGPPPKRTQTSLWHTNVPTVPDARQRSLAAAHRLLASGCRDHGMPTAA